MSPPRSFIDKRDQNPGRFFTQVRFDDWCGKFQTDEASDTSVILEKIRPFLSPEQKLLEATRLMKKGDFHSCLALFESLFESGNLDIDCVSDISSKAYKMHSKEPDDKQLRYLCYTWHKRAADMEHSHACYWFAITLIQGTVCDIDENLSLQYLQKAANLGYKAAAQRLQQGGLTVDYKREHSSV